MIAWLADVGTEERGAKKVKRNGERSMAGHLDTRMVHVLESALSNADREVSDLLDKALTAAAARFGGVDEQSVDTTEKMLQGWRQGLARANLERRLGDRVLYALELALVQKELEVSELLARSLETVLTRFGGLNATDHRDIPDNVLQAFDRLKALREERMGKGEE
ncbi:hypothetical protein WCLP8_1100002 [uncultured Gammaproteobacteria bacterium]